MLLCAHLTTSSSAATSKTFLSSHLHQRRNLIPSQKVPIPQCPKLSNYPKLIIQIPFSSFSSSPSLHLPSCRAQRESISLSPVSISDEQDSISPCLDPEDVGKAEAGERKNKNKSFWGAVSLIIGTAVGPGMLGLPSATIRSGPVPSTIAIILSWVYVVSSILLVAELSFAAMDDDGVEEVSFTALATKTMGPNFGSFVAVVYACLSFSLLIACVSGIGSLVVQQFPWINPVIAHALFPCFVGIAIGFFPFKAIDVANRLLCSLMLFSITALVAIGVSVGRSNLLGSLAYACWKAEAILPAIPVTVLTLGFHVITPFICKIVGDSVYDARKAILIGGAVPLAMVLSWNAVVLGLAGAGNVAFDDPIKLLLSVKSSALPAVRGFAFAALATSLIGYAVSFPKQLVDTVKLIAERFPKKSMECSQAMAFPDGNQKFGSSHEGSQVGFAVCSKGKTRISGKAFCAGGESQMFSNGGNQKDAMGVLCEGPAGGYSGGSTDGPVPLDASSSMSNVLVTWLVLIVPIFIASFFRTAFSKALDFAGVYANCFLFGVLPPAMAWIHRSRKRYRLPESKEDVLPGGDVVLMILFTVAVILGFWH
ncbi:uncharacterized protein [Elaeis guineensis]|uniref:Uncharacterized protein LOC105046076 n=1 Tax=Elaeis guineensis var. tenera TaxID=51953 RepID=A0A6I9R9Q2_ELAGV|nr:uncharacterized protein LOC105046076 [Elaeis guineensis]